MSYTNLSVALAQEEGGSLYCEISSMEGSDDTCAIICVSGSGTFRRLFTVLMYVEVFLASRRHLEGHPWFATLEKDATSIRLFHLRSIEVSKGNLSCARLCEAPH